MLSSVFHFLLPTVVSLCATNLYYMYLEFIGAQRHVTTTSQKKHFVSIAEYVFADIRSYLLVESKSFCLYVDEHRSDRQFITVGSIVVTKICQYYE